MSEADELEAYAAEHGVAALLDHIGLDGLGNKVVEMDKEIIRLRKALERIVAVPVTYTDAWAGMYASADIARAALEGEAGDALVELERLRAALHVYADPRHWVIGRDDLNGRAAIWVGPGAITPRGYPDAPETARDALARAQRAVQPLANGGTQ